LKREFEFHREQKPYQSDLNRSKVKMAPSSKSIVRKGPSSARGSTDFISVKEDEPATIVPVLGTDGIVSFDLHAYWDINPAVTFPCIKGSAEKCPGCEQGNKPSYRALLPVLNGDGELRVFAFGISVERQLVTLEEELGGLGGLKLRVRRSGSGLSTKYQVINTGKTVEVDTTEKEASAFALSKIEVKDRSTILDEMVNAGILDEDARESAGEEEEEIAPVAKKKAKVVEIEEEDDEPVVKKKVVAKKEAAPVKKKKAAEDEWDEE
jgi:hypothetical protein